MSDNREALLHKPLRMLRSPRLILSVTLLLTLGMSFYSYRAVHSEIEFGVRQRAEKLKNVLKFRLQTYVNALTQTRALFVATDNSVSRQSFQAFVYGINPLRQYPGIQGIGYTVRVPATRLAAHIAEIRESGYPGYRVWPEYARAEYFAVLYLEPFDWRNQRAFGYDMFTDPVRRAAMERARDSGQPAASGRVTLVQETETDRQAGFLIYTPVYRPRSSVATVAERRAALVGFVYGAFRVNDVFHEALKQDVDEDWSRVVFKIYDTGADGEPVLLYEFAGPNAKRDMRRNPLFRHRLTLEAAARSWPLEVSMTPGAEPLSTYSVPILILLFGTALSLMLYRILRYMAQQQKIDEQLIKMRNLESIGVLAGGIAHDFNNILTAILGNISLAKMHAQPNDEINEILGEAEKAFWRARDLTQQLLTFAKGGMPIKKTASIAEVLTDTATFALRGTNVRPHFEVSPTLWPVAFDPGQISQVINNLVLNAKQAMPAGGTVDIRAENCTLTPGKVFALRPGKYIRVTVEDTGAGIPPAHIGKIFDPYFTTKQEGSGLGLATSYSIVKRHDGHIEVQSTLGAGTTFTIYLPASLEETPLAPPAPPTRLTGEGSILVMDDEEPVRKVAVELLQRLGYDAVAVADGAEAVDACRRALREQRRFHAAILDLTVPGGMGGSACLGLLRRLDPDIGAVVSSGYSSDPIVAEYRRYGFDAVATKPYQLPELAAAVRTALGARRKDTHSTEQVRL